MALCPHPLPLSTTKLSPGPLQLLVRTSVLFFPFPYLFHHVKALSLSLRCCWVQNTRTTSLIISWTHTWTPTYRRWNSRTRRRGRRSCIVPIFFALTVVRPRISLIPFHQRYSPHQYWRLNRSWTRVIDTADVVSLRIVRRRMRAIKDTVSGAAARRCRALALPAMSK
jgi:hypothetical protein